MRHGVCVELVGVERAARLNEVIHRFLRPDAHGEREVAELEIEVDGRHGPSRLRERDRQVGRGDGLARSALGSEHADHRCIPVVAQRARGTLARKNLLKREIHLLGRLGQAHDVVGSDLEDAAEKTVRRSVRKHHHRYAWTFAHRAGDQEECSLRVTRAGDQKELGRSLLECRPTLVDAPDDADDLDVGGRGQSCPHGLLVDTGVE